MEAREQRNSDRFLAPAPVIIPKAAGRAERLRLRYGAFGPPAGTRDAALSQISGGERRGMSNFIKTLPRK